MERPLATVERPLETVGGPPETVKDRSLIEFRGQVIDFVRRFYEENQEAPSLRTTLEGCETYRSKFYKAFPGGMREACEEAGVHFEEKRAKQVEKAASSKKKAQKAPRELEEEIQADEAEAELEEARRREAAKERIRRANEERLKLEAMHDSEKIVQYLRTLPEIVAPFFRLCEEAELDPQKAWEEGVEILGENWEEWGRGLKAAGEEPCLKAYVSKVSKAFVDKKGVELALDRHREDIYTFTCWSCGDRYEFEFKENHAAFACPNGCKTRKGLVVFYYPCPVCRELEKENGLFYDPARNLLYCKICGFEGGVRGPPLRPKGTRAGTLEQPIKTLKDDLKVLRAETEGLQRQKKHMTAEIEERKRTQERLKTLIEEKRQAWVEERRAYEAEKTELNNERARLLRNIEVLKEENRLEKGKGVIFTAWCKVLMSDEVFSTEELVLMKRTLTRVEKLRSRPGNMGEALKLGIEARKTIFEALRKGGGERYYSQEEHDQDLEKKLAAQRRKHEREIDALRREYDRKIEANRVEHDRKVMELEGKVQRLEGELEDLFAEKEALEKNLSHPSEPRNPTPPTGSLKLIKRIPLKPRLNQG